MGVRVLDFPAKLRSLFVGWGSWCWLSQQYSGHFSWGGGHGAGYPSNTPVTFRGVGVMVLAIPAKLRSLFVGWGSWCWLSQQYSSHFSWGGGHGAGYPSKTSTPQGPSITFCLCPSFSTWHCLEPVVRVSSSHPSFARSPHVNSFGHEPKIDDLWSVIGLSVTVTVVSGGPVCNSDCGEWWACL